MESDAVSSGNSRIFCQYKDHIATFGLFLHRNPLNFSVPLVLLQFVIISATCHLIDVCLRPFGQSLIVVQIIGGVVYGPSLLGRNPAIQNTLFPGRSLLILNTSAAFGLLYFFFAIGVGSNTRMMFHPPKQSVVIGLSAMFSTLIFTILFAFILITYVQMEDSLSRALPFVAASQGLTAFPNVAFFISELKLSNTDVGRVSISAAMMCDFIGVVLITLLLAVVQSEGDPFKSIVTMTSTLMFFLAMAFVVGPIVRRTSKSIRDVKSMAEIHTFIFLAGALVSALITEVIGQHFVLGSLIFGMLVPDGQPLGSALISKLEYPIGKLLYPTFLTMSGFKTDVSKIDLWSLLVLMTLISFACLIKTTAVVCSCYFLSMDIQDSVVIGLVLNARGVCELIMYNLWRETGILPEREFALCVLAVIAVTSITSPIIKYLHDPTRRHVLLKRRTIQHLKPDSQLRMLICIRNQDSIPLIINLLEASHATQTSPIAVSAVLLIELVGRATQMVVAHQFVRSLHPVHLESGHIVNALRQYELCNELCVTVQTFSTVSHLNTMHEEIFRIALDQNATVLILPFHKRWEIDGSIGSENRAMQNMNIMVLNRSPCSVGILVDRAVLTGSLSILNNQSVFRVAVIFIGGPDDAESLCYGARMGRHSRVSLTILRFLLIGWDTSRERKQDNCLVGEVLKANVDSEEFIYREQVVKNGVGLAASLRGLGNSFELMIVGRHHQESEILNGLGAWSECPELGVVGDMLASQDFRGTASVLVVQQQRLPRTKVRSRTGAVVKSEMGHDRPSVSSSEGDPRWEISIDRDRDSGRSL